MLEKLYNCGIRGVAYDLLSSYLTNTKQYTAILGQESQQERILYGVPQGSVLGPLLFLLKGIITSMDPEEGPGRGA